MQSQLITAGNSGGKRRFRLISPRFAVRRSSAVSLSEDQARCVREVRERIGDGRYELVSEPCPCGQSGGSVIARTERYGLPLDTLMCSGCGTLRFDPYLSAESLKNFYVDYYQVMYGRVPDRDAYLRRQASYGKRLLAVAGQFLRKGARVAEVGCGAGGALAVLHDAGYNVSGCDYSEPLLGIGRTLGLDDLRFGGVETLLEPPGSEKYDLVLLHHVFEHLADPVGFLQRLKPALSADGVVVIAVPDVTRIADFPFPSGNLRLFLHIAHKFNFTLRGIDAIARTVDMRVSEMRIELSTEAPELWVTFGSASRSPMNCKGPHGEPTSLLAYLHKVERRFIVGALREKAESVFRRASFGSC